MINMRAPLMRCMLTLSVSLGRHVKEADEPAEVGREPWAPRRFHHADGPVVRLEPATNAHVPGGTFREATLLEEPPRLKEPFLYNPFSTDILCAGGAFRREASVGGAASPVPAVGRSATQ